MARKRTFSHFFSRKSAFSCQNLSFGFPEKDVMYSHLYRFPLFWPNIWGIWNLLGKNIWGIWNILGKNIWGIWNILGKNIWGIWNILGKNIWGIWNICLFDFSWFPLQIGLMGYHFRYNVGYQAYLVLLTKYLLYHAKSFSAFSVTFANRFENSQFYNMIY